MAKLALVFLFAFCVIHLSSGARIVRDVDMDKAGKAFEDVSKNFENFLKTTFTQENMDKIQSGLKDLGEKLSEHGKNIAGQVNQQFNKLQDKKEVAV